MPKYNKNFAKYILKDYESKVFVVLPGATVKNENYDKFRDVGYSSLTQNKLCVKAFVRDTTASELVYRQLGIVAMGAKKIIVKNNDVNLFRLAQRVLIDDIDYYVYNDAVGSKMQILKLDDNYSEITIFLKEK